MNFKIRFKAIVILLVLISLLLPTIAMAQGSNRHFGTQRDRYGSLASEVTESGDLSYMMNWLNGGTGIDRYKGWVWDTWTGDNNGVRFRYVYPTFDPDSSSYWVGDAYTSTGVYYQRVYELQLALYYLGYNTSSNLDGKWGPTTKQAVKDFQYAHSLSADGVVGARTWTRLSYDS